jgi:hypothetical protein
VYPFGQNRTPLKKTIVLILTGNIFFWSCTKNELILPKAVTKPCEQQTANPTGRSYAADSVVNYNCTSSHCGILPLSSKNYWVYQDSLFSDGVFTKVQYDTLRYTKQKQSLADGLVWWEGSINVGLPEQLYASDSSFFGLDVKLFVPGMLDVKKEFGLFTGDSLRYLTSFQSDIMAIGRSLKLSSSLVTEAGTFNDCLYFEKNSRNYRKDQVYFKPGVGVVRYVQETVPYGSRSLKLQQISTLMAMYVE